MSRKKKADTEPTLPFGKHRGKTLAAVLREEPSYLCWFVETIEGCRDVKEAIVALPGFREAQASYYERKRRKEATIRQVVEETARRMFAAGQTPSQEQLPNAEQLDDLCERLFHGNGAEETARLRIVQGIHYGDYVQSGENLSCEKVGDEQYRFQVHEKRHEYEPWIVTPGTDLSDLPIEILEQMDQQMSYCGEVEETRDAKFSETRKHIQRTMNERSPS